MALTNRAEDTLIKEMRQAFVDQHRRAAKLLRGLANGPLGHQDGFTALTAAAGIIEKGANDIEAAAPKSE